ncbi:MAG TPA: AMP-binding protein, partial [Allosphingosinicella sp.]|nr:AMP-binding protein [Allosphingosinicella sp.]
MIREVVSTLVSDAASRFGKAPAFTVPGQETLTFVDVDDRAGRFAGGLAAIGIKAGDHVALHLPNGWEWIVAYHAIARLGAVVVPANILLSPSEVSYMIADSGAKAAIMPADRRGAIDLANGVSAITLGQADDARTFDTLLD